MTWTDLKEHITNKGNVRYNESVNIYDIWIDDLGRKLFSTEIYKDETSHDTDKADFEDNYKDDANSTEHTSMDNLGRWVVRADSRRIGWDTVFQGAGDNMTNGKLGDGVEFVWDFSAPVEDIKWITAPAGFKRQRIDWTFSNYAYIKEGTFYFFDMPKGSYIDFWLVAPVGSWYEAKTLDAELNVVRTALQAGAIAVPFIHWVIKYMIEGSCPMGDELNTESATDFPAPPGLIFRAEVTVPEVTDYENAHGHWALEMYRLGYDLTDDPN